MDESRPPVNPAGETRQGGGGAEEEEERGKEKGGGGESGTDMGSVVLEKNGYGSAKHGSMRGADGVVVGDMDRPHHKDDGEGERSNGEG